MVVVEKASWHQEVGCRTPAPTAHTHINKENRLQSAAVLCVQVKSLGEGGR